MALSRHEGGNNPRLLTYMMKWSAQASAEHEKTNNREGTDVSHSSFASYGEKGASQPDFPSPSEGI
jgi:hypothetical protein